VGHHTEAFVGIDTYMTWLMAQKHRERRIAFEELLEGIRQESEAAPSVWKTPSARRCPSGRLPRLSWSLQAVRGIDLNCGCGVLAEIGDLFRFQNLRELTRYLDLVPSENSEIVSHVVPPSCAFLWQ
jgi:hypothetical protein